MLSQSRKNVKQFETLSVHSVLSVQFIGKKKSVQSVHFGHPESIMWRILSFYRVRSE